MPTPFDTALAFVLPSEGGYVHDPHDNGGATNHGITQATYDAWRTSCGLLTRDVAGITDTEVRAIYEERYWTAGHCAEFPLRLAVAHFDWCVNHGVAGATKTLQAALGFPPKECDGVWGPLTEAALQTKISDPALARMLVVEYLGHRQRWYEDEATHHPDQRRFLNGWLNRVARLHQYIVTLPEG